MTDFVGQKIGEYLVVARLGQGGMAQVYKAYQPRLGRYVAIKILHAHLAEDPDFVNRFEREARACSTLQHSSVVRVFDFSHEEATYYMTLQLVQGVSLKSEMEHRAWIGRPFTYQQVARVCAVYADALQYAHQQGMVHRDIKPANLMLTSDGQAMVLDFGIARIVGETQYTMTGALIGSPAYMSPEQGRSAKVDGRSDIYSLGVVVYEMATGRLPFDEDTPMATLIQHITGSVPLPTSFRPDIPPAMEAVILKALQKKREDRFQSAADMASSLRQALGLPADDSLLREPLLPLASATAVEELSPTDPVFQGTGPITQAVKKPTASLFVVCKSCGTHNDKSTKFCFHCGTLLQIVCPRCYGVNTPEAVHCENCGTNLRQSIQAKNQWRSEEERWREERKRALAEAEAQSFRQQLQNLQDPKQHKNAVFSLKQRGPKAVDPLLQLLHDENANTRLGAIKALVAIGDNRAVPPLVSCLTDPQPAVRYLTLEALGGFKAHTAVEAMGDLLQDDNKQVREKAQQILKQFNTPEARAVLKQKGKKWWSF